MTTMPNVRMFGTKTFARCEWGGARVRYRRVGIADLNGGLNPVLIWRYKTNTVTAWRIKKINSWLGAAFGAAWSFGMTGDANGPHATDAPDAKGASNVRRAVYLPENRHHWVTNDEVKKPMIDILRGPVRPKIPAPENDETEITSAEWMRTYLPRIGATAIVVIVILGLVAIIYTDLAALF